MANLIVPQIKVDWEGTNLCAYTFPNDPEPQPVVFNVKVDMTGGTGWPTGTMSWNPTGPAFKLYEKLVASATEKTVIKVTFGYGAYGGPEIQFFFNYSGTTINYGVDMSISVELACRQAWNSSATRNSVSIDKAEKFADKGVDAIQMSKELAASYSDVKPMLYNECAEKDAKEVKIKRAQFKDQTYGSVSSNLQKQLGNDIFLSNIGSTGETVAFAPLAWQGTKKCGQILPPPKGGAALKSKERYGYIIGPGIITSFTRKMEYAPPTNDQTSNVSNPTNPTQSNTPTAIPGQQKRPATEAQKKATEPSKKAVNNASSPSNVKGVQYSENPNGPQKQEVLNQEEGVKMNAEIFMCPAITGIKPQDVIYVPSLDGKIIEDYKVSTVCYTQDGGSFSVSIQASRPYGLNVPMYKEESKKFLDKAKSLVTLADWEQFAWRERLGLPGL